MKVLAIVPAYNEEDSVAGVVREIHATGLADVLVVNDGSTDGTVHVAEAAGARTLDLGVNLGIGGAVQAGFLYAARHRYDVAVQVDGDGQHIAAEIPHLLEPLAERRADLVLGSRYVRKTGYRSPIARRAGMMMFSAVVTALTRQRFLDTTSGFRAAGRECLEYLARHYPQDYPEVEALVLLKRAGFRVLEVPCAFRDRAGGRSSITASRSAYYVVKVLLAIFIGLFRRVPPRDGSEWSDDDA